MTDFDEHEPRPARRPPRASRMRNLAWGLATAALTFILILPAAAAVGGVILELRAAGVIRPAPRMGAPRTDPGSAADIISRVASLTAALGPLPVAGVIAAVRPRWWYGPVVALALGWVLTVTMAAAGEDDWELVAIFPLWWLYAGLIGGGMSALRRWTRS